jgi:hypothetical protein
VVVEVDVDAMTGPDVVGATVVVVDGAVVPDVEVVEEVSAMSVPPLAVHPATTVIMTIQVRHGRMMRTSTRHHRPSSPDAPEANDPPPGG